jgi:hypothetical protein
MALSLWPGTALAQGGESDTREAYFRAVADHFEVEFEEVGIIGEWALAPDEVPVVLFLTRRAGVSPDALIGLRRSGRSWHDVAARFGVGPRDFHIPITGEGSLGPLDEVYQEFRSRSPRDWSQIRLADGDVVALVNLRFLCEQTGAPHLTVLSHFQEAGTFMAAYPLLLAR